MKSVITGLAITIVAGIVVGIFVLAVEYNYFNPRSPGPSAPNVSPPKPPHEKGTNQLGGVVNKALPDENDRSLISGTRLLALLKPAYAADRLSLIRKLAPKLAVLSGSELKEALDLLYKNQRVSGLEVLLPYIRQPLTDDEIKAVLALFYASEVPRAVSLITSSRESGGVTN
jgi:hypothetical protein